MDSPIYVNLMSFFETYKSGFVIRIKLTPNASFCGFKDLTEDGSATFYLRACVTTAPEKGKANQELIKMLSKKLKIAKNMFQIISGETDHWKKIYVDTPLTEDIKTTLQFISKENNK